MGISFNHPSDTMTSTANFGSLNLVVLGGTPANPRPIRFKSSSVIMPVQQLPAGEKGAMVFDSNTLTMKYHDGSNWIELLSASDVVAPINVQINNIINQLQGKVDTVTYTSSSIPSASISGSILNIVFPLPSTTTGSTGLYTSAKSGSIMQYSLTSGQSVASIREQMSGKTGGQAGRDGSQANPWLTSDGWTFADGMWWTWEGEDGIITKQVPNLNQNAYLKGMTTSGITKTDSPIAASGSMTPFSFTIPDHYHGTGMMNSTGGDSADDGSFIFGRTWNDGNSWPGVGIFGDLNKGRRELRVNGSNPSTALSTTNGIYANPASRNVTHSHTLSDIDVTHFNVAYLYNIAEPSLALSEKVANERYVLKTGDVMSGTLSIANNASIDGDGTNLQLFFRTSTGIERAAIYQQSTTNTLRLRSNGGTEVSIDNTGKLTANSLVINSNTALVGTRNIVRSINGSVADANGDVSLVVGSVQDMRWGSIASRDARSNSTQLFPIGYAMLGTHSNYNDSNWELDTIYGYPLQKLVNGIWITVTQ